MPPPPANPHTARLVDAYSNTTRNVRARVIDYLTIRWHGLDSYRTAGIDRFVAAIVPVVLGAQRQVASLTDGYLAALEASVLGTPARAVGIPAAVIAPAALRGVDPVTVYKRTGTTVWRALAGGAPLDVAVQRGLDRGVSLASTDLQLARTHAARFVISQNGNVTGYRRVPNGGQPCGLCELAADQHYSRGDLMPIHPGCSCDVEPTFAGADPGLIDFEPSAGELDDRFGTDSATSSDVVVQEHGELGPVLAVRGQAFTGPGDF